MKFEYRIVVIGTVSCGKSTLVNTIFAKCFSQININRTTMVPHIYSFDYRDFEKKNEDQIVKLNEEINNRFKDTVWDGTTVIHRQVRRPDDFLPFNDNLDFYIYDLPGINDGKNKATYLKWISENFYLFDCVVLITDVASGLGTAEEAEIVNLTFEKLRENLNSNLIVLFNKCDEMTCVNGEYNLNKQAKDRTYQDACTTIKEKINEYQIANDRINLIKFCAKNANIYRTIHYNSIEEIGRHLDSDTLTEMARNEFGNISWMALTEVQKKNEVNNIIKNIKENPSYYELMMLHTGFTKFKNVLTNVVNHPEIVLPFYKKCIKQKKECPTISKKEWITVIKDVNDMDLEDKIRIPMIQDILDFYLNKFYDSYVYQKRENEDLITDMITRWFVDLSELQEIEDYVNNILDDSGNAYLTKKFSQNYFNKLIEEFLSIVDKIESIQKFIIWVDDFIRKSFTRYSIPVAAQNEYISLIFDKFVKPSVHWGNKTLYDWIYQRGYKKTKEFIIEYVNNTFELASNENIFYLYEISYQVKEKLRNVSYYCDWKRQSLQFRTSFATPEYRVFDSIQDYRVKYGDFIEYLLEKI